MCQYPQQDKKVAELEAQGFDFLTWIPAYEPGDEEARVAVMGKRYRGGTEYREVNPDGSLADDGVSPPIGFPND